MTKYAIDADLNERVIGETREVRRRRRPGAWLFLIATLLAVGALVWWAFASGFLASFESRDGSVPNPPAIEEEGFDPVPQAPDTGSTDTGGTQTAEAETIYVPPAQEGVSTPEGRRKHARRGR